MPSFDIVSEVDIQEVRNAVDQATRELRTRFDFKGVEAGISFENDKIQLAAPEEFQVKQLLDILQGKLISRNVDSRSLDAGPVEGSGKQQVQSFGLKQGIDRETAKKIVKLLKDSKLKVQSQIQGEQVRVTGKKRDDLQGAMAAIKEAKLEIALDFNNFRD